MSKEKSTAQQQDFSEFDFHDSSSDSSSAQSSQHFLNRNRIDAAATPLSPPLTTVGEPPLNVVVRPPTPLKMTNGGGGPQSDNDSLVREGAAEEDDEDDLLEDGTIDKTKALNVAVKQSTNSSSSTRSRRDSSKNVRHQHQIFSKNIYIGTKNAEKWERTRTRLAFKNDVEFVTYLLHLTDSELTAPR